MATSTSSSATAGAPSSSAGSKPFKSLPPELVLYYHPSCVYSQKVVMALHQKKIPFQARFINILHRRQYNEEFLALNPRGEVPVLVDDSIKHIPDSNKIIDYLEDNFSNGTPRLRPEEPDLKNRCDELSAHISDLKIDVLKDGVAIYGARDLDITPKPPFKRQTEKTKVREILEQRKRSLRTEIKKFPQYAEALTQKLHELESDLQIIKNRDQFESLILHFERVLDECEAELSSHDNQAWWLVSPNISIADINLAIMLNRLWLLGFEKRLWESSRPFVSDYFGRVKKLESFRLAISMSSGLNLNQIFDFLTNPYTLGAVGASAVIGGSYYLWSKGKLPDFSFSGIGSLFGNENKPPLQHQPPAPAHIRAPRYGPRPVARS